MGKKADLNPGSEINIPDNFSENFETAFWVKSRADTYIRRTRLISKSDYNLKSGCT